MLFAICAAPGCAGGAARGEAPEGTEGATTGSEAPIDLANTRLPNVCTGGGALNFNGGVASYESGLGPGFDGEAEIQALEPADLDNDGTVEHLALIRCRPGGSGTIDGVWAFHLGHGRFEEVSHIAGGDRADGGLDGARVAGGDVVVERYSGSEEGLCCPTHVTDETWRLEAGAFVRTAVGPSQTVEN